MKSNPFATRFVAPGRLPWISSRELSVERLANQLFNGLQSRGAIVGEHGTGKSTLLEHLLIHLGEVCYRDSVTETRVAKNAQPEGLGWVEGERLAPLPNQENCGRDALGKSRWQAFQPPGRCRLAEQEPTSNLIVIQLRRSACPPLRQIRRSRSYWTPARTLVLDGFEQLSGLGRAWIIWRTRWEKMGLLVTSHRPVVGLPTLCQTTVSAATARLIISELLAKNWIGDQDHDFQTKFVNQDCLAAMLSKHSGNMREVLMELYDEARSSSTLLKEAASTRRQFIKV